MSSGTSNIERRLTDRVAELKRQQANIHNVAPCPKCGAPIGTRCFNLNRRAPARHTMHAHAERFPPGFFPMSSDKSDRHPLDVFDELLDQWEGDAQDFTEARKAWRDRMEDALDWYAQKVRED